MYKSRSTGFTLVEIAIVMVIIGLLLGGALKGQQMIENARYKALKSEIKQIQAAVFSFSDIYGYYPGDIPKSKLDLLLKGATAASSSDDGVPGDGKVTGGICNAGNEEPCMVFHHLRWAGLISGDRALIGVASQFPTPAGGFYDGVSSGWLNGDTSLKLLLQEIPGELAQRLDSEIDDGDGKTGSVVCPDCSWKKGSKQHLHINI